ncbi:MAG: TonB-dependent receptor [Bacteroidota bacterium]
MKHRQRFLSFVIITVLCSLTQSYGQTVLVRDVINSRPVDNVAVFNPGHTRTALTNIYGVADITAFNESDTLIFQHAAYQTYTQTFQGLSGNDYNVYLEKKSVDLDEIIISATRFERDAKDIPNRVISITAEKIRFDNPQTAADMLSHSNEVFVQKSQLGGGSPMIRGFSANKVLIVVDGVRMNNAIFRGGNLQNVIAVDPNSIHRTEVIFGPGTVIYGSDALGGVMSFISLEPKLSEDRNFSSAVNMMARYSTANNERTGHLDVSLAGEKWASVTSFSSSWFDDLRMGSNGPDEYLRNHYVITEDGEDVMVSNADNNMDPRIQRFSAYNQMNVMQKFRYKPLQWLDLTYGFHFSETSDVPRYDRLIQYAANDTLKYASWYYGPQRWMMNVLNAEVDVNCSMITRMKISMAWQKFEESRNSRKFGDPWFKKQFENVDMYTANVDIEKELDENNSFFYGFEGVYNDVKSTAVKSNYLSGESMKTGTRYPDGTNDYKTYAAYLSYERRYSDNMTLFAGIRYSYVALKSSFADTSIYHLPYDQLKINAGALTGSAGASWRPAETWQLQANLASGFRAPNLDDVAKVFDSSPGNVVVPNPDLKPEYAYSIDAGVRKEISELLVFEVSAFYTFLIDAMVRRDYSFNGRDSIWYDGEMSKVEAVVNAGSAHIYGVSAMGILNMGEYLKLKSGISWMQGRDDEDYPLRHVSPLFGNTSLVYKHGAFLAELNANYNAAISYAQLAPTERDKPYIYAIDDNGDPYSPSWWTLNFKSTIRIVDPLHIDIGIENIFNKRYRPYSSGIAAPGRNFFLTLRGTL